VPWQQVVEAFHAESEHWTLDRGRYVLDGWTWGNGPPLYFLHGLTASSELFALLVWLLRDQFRCVLFDLPANRRGTRVRGPLKLHDLTADLFAAADRHRDDRFQLFASSFGCLVAIEAMLERPERIERAVLQGGFAHRKLSAAERLLVRAGHWMPGGLNILAFRRTIQAHNHRPWFPPFDPGRWSFFVETTGRVPIRSIAQRSAIIRDYDGRPRLPEVRQPVLLVRAEGEGLVAGACHDALVSGLPRSRTEWLHSSGHLPYLTHPHRLANVIRPFLLGDSDAAGATPPEGNAANGKTPVANDPRD